MSEIEAAVYEGRRLLAALLGRAEPPPGILGPLVGGVLATALLVGAEVVRRVQ
ncbi:hypothetical protein SAMN04487968_10476 [Nocardioides terrae]|uniref:Uncharacterized protein n=1 Tax=Nocardioides terrae TaxID=574651 RepID=A0A1I1H236_9ACTN|nr:hypothetical protein [Nocardioides terrae]SFC15240.1 hypothetical protein SAMN04487968_10476 [Nocardioides terrae]